MQAALRALPVPVVDVCMTTGLLLLLDLRCSMKKNYCVGQLRCNPGA